MAAAITTYATLTSAINDFSDRSYAAGETDRFIGLAEAEFRLYLGPNYAKETSVTLAFTSGSATLPTGFIRALSLIHATYGGLEEKSAGAVREQRVWDTSGIATIYAITAATVITAAVYTGNLTFGYEGTLTGLSGSNTTNWLITNAPQSYLSMCLSFEKAFQEDYASAALLKGAALKTLDDLGMQSIIGQFSRGSVTIPGMTP